MTSTWLIDAASPLRLMYSYTLGLMEIWGSVWRREVRFLAMDVKLFYITTCLNPDNY